MADATRVVAARAATRVRRSYIIMKGERVERKWGGADPGEGRGGGCGRRRGMPRARAGAAHRRSRACHQLRPCWRIWCNARIGGGGGAVWSLARLRPYARRAIARSSCAARAGVGRRRRPRRCGIKSAYSPAEAAAAGSGGAGEGSRERRVCVCEQSGAGGLCLSRPAPRRSVSRRAHTAEPSPRRQPARSCAGRPPARPSPTQPPSLRPSLSLSHSSIVTGSSMYPLNACNHCAPRAPSTTRWSHESVAASRVAGAQPRASSAAGSTTSRAPPTARIAA